MAKLEIEKRFGQEACQRTCSIFFFVEKFLKHTLTVLKLPIASWHGTFTIFTSHQTHIHWIMIYAILNLLFFCSRRLDWSAWSNPKFIYVSLFFSSPQMIYTTKPAHPSMTSCLLKNYLQIVPFCADPDICLKYWTAFKTSGQRISVIISE